MKFIIKNLKASLNAKYPVLRFVLIFATLMGAFYFFFFTPFFQNTLSPAYLRFDAEVSGIILNWLGQNVSVVGTNIVYTTFSLNIVNECGAMEPIALFICAVLAFSAPFLLKIPGIVFGTLFLLTLNLIRIVSLFLVRRYYPQAFHMMHFEVWQILFILLTVLFFVLWLLWIIRHERYQQYVHS